MNNNTPKERTIADGILYRIIGSALTDLQNNVPKHYRGTERTAYLTGLMDISKRIFDDVLQEVSK